MINRCRALPRWFPALAIAGVLLPAETQGQDPSAMFSQAEYPAGSSPQDVASGDFDGDGLLDLAVANRFSSNVSVLIAQHDGSYAPAGTFFVGSQPLAIVAADLDDDGHLDLATANAGASSLSLLYGAGDGGFSPGPAVGVPSQPVDLAAADLDGDGRPELAVAHDLVTSPVSLLWSSSNFAPAPLDSGYCASSVGFGDLDGDGMDELLVADCSGNQLRSYRGQGAAGPGAMSAFAVPLAPEALVVLDADDDGILDVAVASSGASSVSVLLGDGVGGLGAAQSQPVGVQPQALASGDVDGDGDADLVSANFATNDLSLLLGAGDGSFGAAVSMSAGLFPGGLEVADFNGDGADDIAAANAFSNDVSVFLAAPPPWADLGGHVAGKAGDARLEVEGLPRPGESVIFTVVMLRGKTKHAQFIAGFEDISQPFKGGVMVPSLDARRRVPTGRPVAMPWPDLPPGTPVYFQAWLKPKSRAGVAAATNALRGTTQAP